MADEKVFGYELLFRDGVEDYFRATDADAASRQTLDSTLQVGLEVLCNGHRGFVNCTREILLKDYMTLLPSPRAGGGALGARPPGGPVRAARQTVKQAGSLGALACLTILDAPAPPYCFADRM